MTRRRLGLALGCAFACACANILGIDDGNPRESDGATTDSSVPDVTSLPDVTEPDVVVEAAPDVPVSPLACGDASCNAITEACCRTGSASQADAESFACAPADASCAGLRVTCDESANCTALGHPGEECCAVLPDGGSVAIGTACVAAGTCSTVTLCEPGDDEVCNADAGKSCNPSSSTILGWEICK